MKVDPYLGCKCLRVRAVSQVRQYYNIHQQRHFTNDKTNLLHDNITRIDFCEHIKAFRTLAIYGFCFLAEKIVAFRTTDGRYTPVLKSPC